MCYKICNKYGFHYPVVEQSENNMLARKNVEVDSASIFKRYYVGSSYGTSVWRILSGKYND